MSGIITSTTPPPPQVPSIRAGETDGRYIDCTNDLGPADDKFPSISVLSIAINRVDGNPTTANDLQPAGSAWPNTLDSTGLIPTFGFIAPLASGGTQYRITMTANKTVEGRVFVRDVLISVAAQMG